MSRQRLETLSKVINVLMNFNSFEINLKFISLLLQSGFSGLK